MPLIGPSHKSSLQVGITGSLRRERWGLPVGSFDSSRKASEHLENYQTVSTAGATFTGHEFNTCIPCQNASESRCKRLHACCSNPRCWQPGFIKGAIARRQPCSLAPVGWVHQTNTVRNVWVPKRSHLELTVGLMHVLQVDGLVHGPDVPYALPGAPWRVRTLCVGHEIQPV